MSKNPKEKELLGKRVKLTRTIRSKGGDIFRKGSIMIVERKWAGWQLARVGNRRKYINRVGFDCFSLEPK